MDEVRRNCGLLIVCLMGLAACQVKTRASVRPQETATYSYGAGLIPSSPDEPASEASTKQIRSGKTGFLIHLKGQNNTRPDGVIVSLSGPQEFELMSDDNGEVRATATPGLYKVAIRSGCFGDVTTIVQHWSTQSLGVVDGSVAEATFPISWIHRYRPWPPADSDVVPTWPIGQEVRVQFFVADRCDSNRRSPNARYPTFRFKSSLLTFPRPPILHADERGLGYVDVSCQKEGSPDLISYDERYEGDRVDLAKESISTGVPMECR